MTRQKIVVVGASGHAKVVIDMLQLARQFEIVGIIDTALPAGSTFQGCPVLGPDEVIDNLPNRAQLHGFIVAIGDNGLRARVTQNLLTRHPELTLVTAVHPAATVAHDATLGAGTVVMAEAVIGPGCRADTGCIINTRASLDHDGHMEDYASLAPAAVTGGDCRIGNRSAIGIGATLKHGVTIGQNSIIGAGATVMKDIGDNRVAYGTPAEVIRSRADDEPYL